MCGRYTLFELAEAHERLSYLDAKDVDDFLKEFSPRYNISPSQTVPVITNQNNPTLTWMRWGLLPPYIRDPKDLKFPTFNARSEGIFEKRTWKDPILKRRVLIPTNGFYEWKRHGKEKQPYFIHLENNALFTFAGIYNTWIDKDGKEQGTFSIVTTTPNREMEPIHDRMPVILDAKDELAWLDPTLDEKHIAELMVPYWDNRLQMHEVSQDVNSSRGDDKAFILPV